MIYWKSLWKNLPRIFASVEIIILIFSWINRSNSFNPSRSWWSCSSSSSASPLHFCISGFRPFSPLKRTVAKIFLLLQEVWKDINSGFSISNRANGCKHLISVNESIQIWFLEGFESVALAWAVLFLTSGYSRVLQKIFLLPALTYFRLCWLEAGAMHWYVHRINIFVISWEFSCIFVNEYFGIPQEYIKKVSYTSDCSICWHAKQARRFNCCVHNVSCIMKY